MRLALAVAGAIALACAPNPDPVPVLGAAVDVSALAGEWYGDYSSTESGRAGSIVFSLNPGSDTARGDVLMSAPGVVWNPAVVDAHQMRTQPPPDTLSRVLTVSFVQVQSGEVSGRLEPYTDPRCQCTALTEFLGRLTADTLVGTYTTHLPEGVTQHGRWRVERRRH